LKLSNLSSRARPQAVTIRFGKSTERQRSLIQAPLPPIGRIRFSWFRRLVLARLGLRTLLRCSWRLLTALVAQQVRRDRLVQLDPQERRAISAWMVQLALLARQVQQALIRQFQVLQDLQDQPARREQLDWMAQPVLLVQPVMSAPQVQQVQQVLKEMSDQLAQLVPRGRRVMRLLLPVQPAQQDLLDRLVQQALRVLFIQLVAHLIASSMKIRSR